MSDKNRYERAPVCSGHEYHGLSAVPVFLPRLSFIDSSYAVADDGAARVHLSRRESSKGLSVATQSAGGAAHSTAATASGKGT